MPINEKKGITVKIDAELHVEVRQYLEKHEMTMAEFVTMALQDELHPKLNMTEVKNMGNMRTLAFQVSEKLFQQIKDYLQRNNMTQKEFVIGLIESEIERDLTQRQAASEIAESSEDVTEDNVEREEITTESDFETGSEEDEKYAEEQENGDFSEDFEDENGECESADGEEEQDEVEEMGMTIGM